MATLPTLSETEVRNWIDSGSFSRGRRYYQNGHIVQPRRQGDTLKAQCVGSAPAPYRVEVSLDKRGIGASSCSCPIGGHCKHCVALLLTWVHEPETFTEMEELTTTLESRSKDELIELINKMLDRHPDLEMLLELPTSSAAQRGKPVSADAIRNQVLNTTPGDYYDRYDYHGYDPSDQLENVVQLGHDYADAGDWSNAATVYMTTMETLLDNYEMYFDEDGEIGMIVGECEEGLGNCLKQTEDTKERERILRALFNVYKWDIDFGGIGMGDEAFGILLGQTSAEEKAQIATWVRAALPAASGDSFSSGWKREAYGGFLLRLEADTLDDEAFLRICRETGRLADLVDRLLTLERVDEAVSASEAASDYELLQLADIFRTYEHDEIAWRLIEQRAKSSTDQRLKTWLKERAAERGDTGYALSLAKTLFWDRPDTTRYADMKTLAEQTGEWPSLRAEIIAQLTDKENYRLLTQIHLQEGQIDQALRTVEHVKRGGVGFYWGGNIGLQVAEAAEADRPDAAVRIYLEEAERLIAARGRGNYASAAQMLQRVQRLYRKLNQEETWNQLIRTIREQNSRLPAMQDEFNQAGL